MKPRITFSLFILSIAVIITGCSLIPQQQDTVDDSNTGMANPASVYCQEQGYQLEIREDANGQYGVCIFPDGSTCEEWAYFRGECQPSSAEPASSQPEPQEDSLPISQTAVALYGKIISSGTEVPAHSIMVTGLEDNATIYITGETGNIENEIIALQNKPEPANKANFWGRLNCPALDQCLLTVTSMRVDGPGEFPPPDEIEAWTGVIYSGPDGPRSGGDDYFALLGSLPFQYGIDSTDDSLRMKIEQLRDSGQAVRIWGQLFAGRPDWNGTQIMITGIIPIDVDPGTIPPAPEW